MILVVIHCDSCNTALQRQKSRNLKTLSIEYFWQFFLLLCLFYFLFGCLSKFCNFLFSSFCGFCLFPRQQLLMNMLHFGNLFARSWSQNYLEIGKKLDKIWEKSWKKSNLFLFLVMLLSKRAKYTSRQIEEIQELMRTRHI